MRRAMGAILSSAVAVFTAVADTPPPTVITFAQTANRHPVSGFGGEWDPHFWRQPNTKRGCDEKAWDTVCRKIRDMRIGRIRTSIMPDWYEPENDNGDAETLSESAFTWDSEPMASLYRHLDVCQASGIKVTLTWWCAPVHRQSDGAPFWLASQGSKAWCSAPNDVEECAENVVAGLRYLIDQRGYSCIDTFTFYNEPDWSFYGSDNKVDFEHYKAICLAIDRRLREVGLRERLKLDLADASTHSDWLERSVQRLGDAADRFNVHSYVFSCEDAGYPEAIRAWVRKWVVQCGDKPLATNELGTRHYKGAYSVTDIETFERGFLTAQYAILGLNEGMTGALFWGLYDQYYYEGTPGSVDNGGMMKTNLMAYVDEDWRVRPSGQAWTLICHGAPVDAKVYAGRSEHPDVDAVCTVATDGAVRVLLVNRAKEAQGVRLAGVPAKGSINATVFARDALAAIEHDPRHDTVTLPPESIVLVKYLEPA